MTDKEALLQEAINKRTRDAAKAVCGLCAQDIPFFIDKEILHVVGPQAVECKAAALHLRWPEAFNPKTLVTSPTDMEEPRP